MHEGNVMSTLEGKREYSRGCLVHQGHTMMNVGDMSTQEDLQCIGVSIQIR